MKTIKLRESDLQRIVKKVINETDYQPFESWEEFDEREKSKEEKKGGHNVSDDVMIGKLSAAITHQDWSLVQEVIEDLQSYDITDIYPKEGGR